MTILELRNNLLSLDVSRKVVELYEKHSNEFLRANKHQMWDGKNPDGTDISPSYLDDPYFKTRKAAEGYARWKQRITGNPNRNKYAPNLFINGYFYSTLILKASEKPTIEVHDGFGSKVASGHPKALGVSKEHLKEIADKYFLPEFFGYIESKTGLRLN
jgi:hypothetical protein